MSKDKQIKEEIVYYAKLLDEKGLVNPLEGNISIYDRENNKLYITPTGIRKSFLTEEKIAVLQNGVQIDGTLKRSSEYLLHEVALNNRLDCNAVVHTHAPYLTAFAYCNMDIKLRCSSTFALLFEDIPCLPFGQPGTPYIANGIDEAIKEHDLILLANHGCLSIGPTLEKAVSTLEAGEEVVKIYSFAQRIGKIHDINKEEWEKMCNTHPGSRRNRYNKN